MLYGSVMGACERPVGSVWEPGRELAGRWKLDGKYIYLLSVCGRLRKCRLRGAVWDVQACLEKKNERDLVRNKICPARRKAVIAAYSAVVQMRSVGPFMASAVSACAAQPLSLARSPTRLRFPRRQCILTTNENVNGRKAS